MDRDNKITEDDSIKYVDKLDSSEWRIDGERYGLGMGKSIYSENEHANSVSFHDDENNVLKLYADGRTFLNDEPFDDDAEMMNIIKKALTKHFDN